jgi:hypothetical protein
VRFYLGTHEVGQKWWDEAIALFVSRTRLARRATLPVARAGWALDSGGFTQLDKPPHRYTFTATEYVADVHRFADEVGQLDWVAPMDWMCEPRVRAKTGLTVAEHQRRTVANFLILREQLGLLVVPVLQGWTRDDYMRCWDLYYRAGVDLTRASTVGVGSICRRQNTAEAALIVRSLAPLRLHGFGVKLTGLESFGGALLSADSMAWSYRARRDYPLPGCTHKSCANCLRYALRWRANLLERLGQQRLEMVA